MEGIFEGNIDLIQARYGWSDEEIKYDIPYARFLQLVRVITKRKVEEYKQRLHEQAYLGWLIVQPVVGKRRITFCEWLEGLGLAEGKESKIENLKDMKKKSLEIAQKIIDADKKRRS